MIRTKKIVALSAAASSQAIAATAPARIPPRRAASTVLAARSLRESCGPGTSRSAAVVLMAPRYRAPARKSPMANPRISGRPGHPLLLVHEALLGRLLHVRRQQREGEADERGEPVAERDLRVREDVDLGAVDQADERERAADRAGRGGEHEAAVNDKDGDRAQHHADEHRARAERGEPAVKNAAVGQRVGADLL